MAAFLKNDNYRSIVRLLSKRSINRTHTAEKDAYKPSAELYIMDASQGGKRWKKKSKAALVRESGAPGMLEVYSPGDMQSPDYECGIWVPICKPEEENQYEAAEIVSTMMVTGIL